MRFISIIALALVAAIGYGILHDQITARVCLEYFTIGHPRIFPTESPTLLALGWGIIATWWFALPLGFALACAARLGDRPKKSAGELFRPLVVLLTCNGALAALAGIGTYLLARGRLIPIDPWVVANVPAAARLRFLADWSAHTTSYAGGFVGSVVLCLWVWKSRRPRRDGSNMDVCGTS
jgi:hypothetical protein